MWWMRYDFLLFDWGRVSQFQVMVYDWNGNMNVFEIPHQKNTSNSKLILNV